MIPVFVGLAIYSGIGLVVRHYRFPKEPVYVAAVWPVVFGMGSK
jgi:hypothetical protein